MQKINSPLPIILIFFTLMAFPCIANLAIDESLTFKYMSKHARIHWPSGGFHPFISINKNPHIATFMIVDEDKEKSISVNLTGLTIDDKITLLIHGTHNNNGVVGFKTKESHQLASPMLIFTNKHTNKKTTKTVILDTYFTKNSRKALGAKKFIFAGGKNFSLLQFDLTGLDNNQETVELLLHLTKKQYGNADLQIDQLINLPKKGKRQSDGIATLFPSDNNIDSHPNVFYSENFNTNGWVDTSLKKLGFKNNAWTNTLKVNYISHENLPHYSKTKGKSLAANFEVDKHLGSNLEYVFKSNHGREPEEAYFRYYLMLAPGTSVSGGGKLPGFSGTYNKAGWGGRPNNGRNGWSARGAFFKTVANKLSPWLGETPIGSYIYEANNNQRYGDTFAWGDQLSTLKNGQWYCIEQHIKLNTPKHQDGILEAWVDGIKVYQKNDLYVRDTAELKIEKVWFNFFFGGTERPRQNFDMYLDNIVIASSYIGPLSTQIN